ncbi:hypothetical protein NKJ26_03050 [Mesorhizobium sp. M0152]|uniref:hypothetical protein n=1 Tax=Mesorhizobium sp. M0152 TaxID=2956898 RepID=UPI003338929A
MDKNNEGYGAGFIGGVLLFVFILNVIYTDDGFRPSWLNQITFWTFGLFAVGFVLRDLAEGKRQRKHQEWLVSLTDAEREAHFRVAPIDDEKDN